MPRPVFVVFRQYSGFFRPVAGGFRNGGQVRLGGHSGEGFTREILGKILISLLFFRALRGCQGLPTRPMSNSQRESMRLEGREDEVLSRLQPHDELARQRNCCLGRMRGRGAAVKNLSCGASFQSCKRITPSNLAIQHLERAAFNRKRNPPQELGEFRYHSV